MIINYTIPDQLIENENQLVEPPKKYESDDKLWYHQ